MISKKLITEEVALRKLTMLCARSEHSTGEMIEKMRKWGIAKDAQDRILDYLITHQYVDDERYTNFFIDDKITFNQWGRRKIEQALWNKGISKNIYQPLLDEVDDERYLQVLRPLLSDKYPTINAKTEYERSMKLIKFALSRGFSYDQIKKCINEGIIKDDIEFSDETAD